MVLDGTVTNGVIILDGGAILPEGSKVRVELSDEGIDERIPLLEPGDRESELAILRESLDDMSAGRVRPARELLRELAAKHNLPLAPGE